MHRPSTDSHHQLRVDDPELGMLAVVTRYGRTLSTKWQEMPTQCGACGELIGPEMFGDDNTAWCPHCHRVSEIPLLKIKDWIAGVVLLLYIKVQAGI